jgi:hypothetical protein
MLAVWLLALGARAEPDETLQLALIVSRADEVASKELAAAVEGQLVDLRVELHVEWVDAVEADPQAQLAVAAEIDERQPVDAVVWVHSPTAETALLFISDTGSDTSLLRIVRFDGDVRESRFESLALVLRGVAMAFLEGGQIGIIAPAPQPQPAPEPQPPLAEPEPEEALPAEPPDLPSGRVELAVSYFGALHVAAKKYLNGARAQLAFVPLEWLRVFVAYRLQLPYRSSNELAAIRVSPHPFEAGVSGVWRVKTFALGGGAALVADRVTWSVNPNAPEVREQGSSSRWTLAASPHLIAGVVPNRFAAIFVAVGIDLNLYRWDFVVETADDDRILVNVGVARPWFAAGVSFRFL